MGTSRMGGWGPRERSCRLSSSTFMIRDHQLAEPIRGGAGALHDLDVCQHYGCSKLPPLVSQPFHSVQAHSSTCHFPSRNLPDERASRRFDRGCYRQGYMEHGRCPAKRKMKEKKKKGRRPRPGRARQHVFGATHRSVGAIPSLTFRSDMSLL